MVEWVREGKRYVIAGGPWRQERDQQRRAVRMAKAEKALGKLAQVKRRKVNEQKLASQAGRVLERLKAHKYFTYHVDPKGQLQWEKKQGVIDRETQRDGWYLLLAAALLALNPYLLDYESAARGYGMAVAFLMLALWEMLEWLREPGTRAMVLAGIALGLSVAANLVLAPPVAGMALMFLWAVWSQHKSFEPAVTVSKKGTKKETPSTNIEPQT